MAFRWIHESTPVWDNAKRRIVAGAGPAVFGDDFEGLGEGDLVPGEWWRVEDDSQVVGFGWLDVNWGDAEVLLATDETARGRGVGTFILEQLQHEARIRGLNHIYNVVRSSHPRREQVTSWLRRRGFESLEDGRLLRSVL
jgi:GNAT superfamily N-acetyltransferase